MSEDVGLSIPITADPNPLKQAMNEVKSHVAGAMEGVKTSMENVRLAMGVVGIAAAGYFKSAVESAAKAQESTERLKIMLENQGQSWNTAKGSVDTFVSGIKNMSVHTGGEAKEALQTLLSKHVNLNEAMKMQVPIAELAAAKHISLAEAANVLADAENGRTRGLVSMGILTKAELKTNMSMDEILGRIKKQYKGLSEEEMQTLPGQIALMKRNFTELSTSIGTVLLPYIMKLAEFLKGLSDNLKNLSPEAKNFIADTLLATATIGTLVGGLSVASKVSGLLTPVLNELGFSVKSLTLPILGVVAGIALVAAGAYLIIKNWEPIKKFVQELWDGIKKKITDTWSDIKTSFDTLKKEVMDKFQDKLDDIKKALEKHQTAIKVTAGILTTIFGPALLKTGIQATISGAQLAANFVANIIKTGTEATISGAKTTASFVASIIKSGVQAVIAGAKISASFIANIVKAGIQAVITGGQITIHLIAATIAYAAEGWKAAAAIMAQTAAWIANKAQIIIATVALVAHKIATIASTGVTYALAAAQWALNVAMDANPIGLIILAIAGLIAAGVMLYKHWDEVKAKVKELWNNFNDLLGGLPNKAIKWGEGLINGFIDGIKGAAHKVGDAVGDVIKGVKKFLGFNSPAEEGEGRHIVEWGANMIGGFMDGVKSQLPNLKTLMSNAIQAPMLSANVKMGAIGGISPAYAGASSSNVSTNHQYIIKEGAIQINARDLKEIKDVHTFFKNITPVLIQGVR